MTTRKTPGVLTEVIYVLYLQVKQKWNSDSTLDEKSQNFSSLRKAFSKQLPSDCWLVLVE